MSQKLHNCNRFRKLFMEEKIGGKNEIIHKKANNAEREKKKTAKIKARGKLYLLL